MGILLDIIFKSDYMKLIEVISFLIIISLIFVTGCTSTSSNKHGSSINAETPIPTPTIDTWITSQVAGIFINHPKEWEITELDEEPVYRTADGKYSFKSPLGGIMVTSKDSRWVIIVNYGKNPDNDILDERELKWALHEAAITDVGIESLIPDYKTVTINKEKHYASVKGTNGVIPTLWFVASTPKYFFSIYVMGDFNNKQAGENAINAHIDEFNQFVSGIVTKN